LRLGDGVASLVHEGGSWRVGLESGRAIDASAVWSTAPLGALPQVIGDVPAGVRDAAARLEHRALVLVYLVIDRPAWTEFDAHYFPSLDVLPARVSEPKRYRDNAADPRDRTVLCAEVACTIGDDVWRADDDALGARVADDLARCGLPAARPVEVVTLRLPRVYPVYRPGFEWDVARLLRWVDQLPALRVLGRQGLFVPDNTHHVLAMGWDCAATADDDGAWARSLDSYRTNVVED
jgi:protoporphyrinogen oxidase